MQPGPYQADAYGQVELTVVTGSDGADHVTATASGGPCDFPAGTEVLTGDFQSPTSSVMVGGLLLCQDGPQCEPKQERYPVLAFYTGDGVLNALVRLREGCTSRALPPGVSPPMVVLRAVAREPAAEPAAEPRGAVPPPAPVPAPAPTAVTPPRGGVPEGAGSAAQVAKAQGKTPDVAPLELGQQLLAERKYRLAKQQFELALAGGDKRAVPAALVGLGASQLGLNDVSGALATLEGAPRSRPEVCLWLAYAHHRDKNPQKVRELLLKAIANGLSPGSRTMDAEAEAALEDALAEAREQYRKRQLFRREQAGTGIPRP